MLVRYVWKSLVGSNFEGTHGLVGILANFSTTFPGSEQMSTLDNVVVMICYVMSVWLRWAGVDVQFLPSQHRNLGALVGIELVMM